MPAEFRRTSMENIHRYQIDSTFDISFAKLIDLNQLELDYVKRKLDSAFSFGRKLVEGRINGI